VKKVALELGGKNPNIVFADADFDTAVDMALTAVFLHSGQVCPAGARLLVEDSLHDRFVDEVVRRASEIRLGGPFDEQAQTGPLISAAHRAKVEAYVAKGLEEGAVLRCGGARPSGPGFNDGFYYLPTVLDECSAGMSVVQDESFGPVLTVERFTSEDQVVRLANDTIYGLAGAVWTSDEAKAARVAARLRLGTAGSTTTTPMCRRRSGAVSSSPASGANSDRRAWPSTARRSTSGATRLRHRRVGSANPRETTRTRPPRITPSLIHVDPHIDPAH
jgi:betaine-aldehyde dehydrogenase